MAAFLSTKNGMKRITDASNILAVLRQEFMGSGFLVFFGGVMNKTAAWHSDLHTYSYSGLIFIAL